MTDGQTQGLQGLTVVAGLGVSGLACLRHLLRQGVAVAATDTRADPPGLAEARGLIGARFVSVNGLDDDMLAAAKRIVVSPGLTPRHPALRRARAAGVPVVGELALFAEALLAHPSATVLAVTGSNGKSTVTTLLGDMLRAAGRRVAVGGNLGPPALDLLDDGCPAVDCHVLEVSSFQLEAAGAFCPDVAAVLNLSADHLDRHGSLARYAAIKRRIFAGDGVMVLNADDARVRSMARRRRSIRWFGETVPGLSSDFGVTRDGESDWLTHGQQRLLSSRSIRLHGRHNLVNAAAALAMADAVGADLSACLTALRAFSGLPHRMETVAERSDVVWINDSKATNIGATLAAVRGLERPCVLLAGGVAKGQDFRALAADLPVSVRMVIVFGADAPLLLEALSARSGVTRVGNLCDAVNVARSSAVAGDVVLLSPACASFDQYTDYAARGDHFRQLVMEAA